MRPSKVVWSATSRSKVVISGVLLDELSKLPGVEREEKRAEDRPLWNAAQKGSFYVLQEPVVQNLHDKYDENHSSTVPCTKFKIS